MKINQLNISFDKIKVLYLFILAIVFGVFLILAFLNIQIKKQISSIDVYESPVSFVPQKFPVLSNVYEPFLSAQSSIILDKNSQTVLFEKNSTLRFPPASTTKIMTALVALEYYKPDDVLPIKQANVEGSGIGFKVGEKFTFESLFYAMLLPSANDATQAIAQNYPGGIAAFVDRMNQKAKELNLYNSFYADPIGLDDNKDFTTSLDLARLTSVALNNSYFAKAVSTRNREIADLSGQKFSLENLNKLLGMPGVNGVKTGTTQGAGQVLVTSRTIGDQDLIFVVMQSQDRFSDTQTLFNYLENNLTYLSIHP